MKNYYTKNERYPEAEENYMYYFNDITKRSSLSYIRLEKRTINDLLKECFATFIESDRGIKKKARGRSCPWDWTRKWIEGCKLRFWSCFPAKQETADAKQRAKASGSLWLVGGPSFPNLLLATWLDELCFRPPASVAVVPVEAEKEE